MNTELTAPETYNITDEVMRFKENDTAAVAWRDQGGDRKDISYRELARKINQYAQALNARGIHKGDRVLVLLPRIPEAYFTYLACMRAGIIAVPCSEMLREKDLRFRMEHAEAKGVVAFHKTTAEVNKIGDYSLHEKFIIGGEEEGWTPLEQEADAASNEYQAPVTSREDTVVLSYTSGTTGNPKGVVHTHGWGYAHVRTAAREWLGVEEGDVVWATAAPGWQKWIWSPLLSTITLGATAFVYNGAFDASTYLSLLEKEKINVLCCTPTEYRMMAKLDDLASYNLQELKSAVSAGEPLNRPVIQAFKDAFQIEVRDGYGQTENTLLVCNVQGMTVKPGSMGKPTPGNPVDIISSAGDPVEPGETGDIAVHKDCPALFKEYYRDPEKTDAAFRGEWYVTGDQALKDEDGYFWFKGRSDDIIISSGYTIGPFEVEDVLLKHTSVKECAVIASPDEIRGSVVKACIVLKDPAEESEELKKKLQDYVKQMTAPYKYPRKIEFMKELPKTASGKIRRIELREEE
ncbi:acyl-CoA synthetase [Alkalicoccus daliensis]|uniref:Acetyl-CoA synthetase n=1 Tax=Alkalicoccus daliensis TaxID=745820 RepID=A0A1H0L1N0_9BACI|nr:acetyl-CoA synthetase [Alkalicoccus daliensis]